MAMFESSEKKKEAEKSVESLNRASLFNYSFARSMKDANRGQSAELFQMETKQIGRRTSKRIIEP